MKYTIEHDKPSGVCIVRVSGEHKRPEDSKVLQGVARDFRAETGCTSFLYDMRKAAITSSTISTFHTATAAVDEQCEHDFRIALLYHDITADHKFLEVVLMNRGYIVRVFADTEEAMSWLSSDATAT